MEIKSFTQRKGWRRDFPPGGATAGSEPANPVHPGLAVHCSPTQGWPSVLTGRKQTHFLFSLFQCGGFWSFLSCPPFPWLRGPGRGGPLLALAPLTSSLPLSPGKRTAGREPPFRAGSQGEPTGRSLLRRQARGVEGRCVRKEKQSKCWTALSEQQP